ncbi:unnamed protein product [Durusdinium trenchii]|uniref:RNA-editing substrate-binding complex 6 protein domain-containing protein n=3 Tax=Durusdinium trenchii TaxID=1381693 RepID=A0ABP0RFE0_9DINO
MAKHAFPSAPTTHRGCLAWRRCFSSEQRLVPTFSSELDISSGAQPAPQSTCKVHGVLVQRRRDPAAARWLGKRTLKATLQLKQQDGPTATLAGVSDELSSTDEGAQNSIVTSLSLRQQRQAVAERKAEEMMENQDLLELHPDRLAVQQDLLTASSVGRVLALCSAEEVAQMDAINLVTACHRIAKLHHGSSAFLKENPHFEWLIDRTGQKLQDLKPRGMVHIFWALVKLEHWPSWLPELMTLFTINIDTFTGRDLSVILGALAKFPKAEGSELKEAALAELRFRLPQLQGPTDIACVASSLCRLHVRDEQLFAALAISAQRSIADFSMSDIVSVLWAFASLNLTHSELFAEIRQVLHREAENCSPKELTQITWALSRLKEADEDLLRHVMAPVIRAKLLEFEVPRDLCTLAFAYSNARVMEEGLFSDLAHILSSKVRLMNAHDISSVVAAFATIEYAHKSFFKALKRHTKATLQTFTPLQLARTIHGFGIAGVDDPSLYRKLCDEVMKKREQLHAKNLVEILIGLAEAEVLPESALTLLNVDTAKWLDAKSCIQALHALSRLPQLGSEAFQKEVLKVIRKKAQGWWRFEVEDLADLIEVMVVLNLQEMFLLKLSLGQMPRLLRNSTTTGFLRLWGGLSELPAIAKEQVQEEIHRNQHLRNAIASCIQQGIEAIASMIEDNDSNTQPAMKAAAELMLACASLGWDTNAQSLADLIMTLLEDENVKSGPHEAWWVSLAWASGELGFEELSKTCLKICLDSKDLSEEDRRRLSTVALFVNEAGTDCFGPDPDGLREALCEAPGNFPQEDTSSTSSRSFKGSYWHPEMHSSSKGSSSEKVDHISRALVEMNLPHEKTVKIAGLHEVDIRLERALLLILGPKDLATSGKALGSTVARKRALEAMGFMVKEIYVQEVELAITSGSLQELLWTCLAEVGDGLSDGQKGLTFK